MRKHTDSTRKAVVLFVSVCVRGKIIVKQIHITLLYHDLDDNWSVDVDGVIRDHISSNTVDALVEYAVVSAQEALLVNRDKSATTYEMKVRSPN